MKAEEEHLREGVIDSASQHRASSSASSRVVVAAVPAASAPALIVGRNYSILVVSVILLAMTPLHARASTTSPVKSATNRLGPSLPLASLRPRRCLGRATHLALPPESPSNRGGSPWGHVSAEQEEDEREATKRRRGTETRKRE